MKKQLRYLSLAAALGCAVFVVAQVAAPVRSGGNSQASGARGAAGEELFTINGKVYARREAKLAPQPAHGPNAVQQALQHYICAKQGYFIELVTANGFENRVANVIETSDYWLLTTMEPDQQQYEVHNVWQVDVWAPNSRWQEIAKAPSMVKELLKLDPKLEAKVAAYAEAESVKHMAPYLELERRLFTGKEYQNLTEVQKRQRYLVELKKLHGNKTKVDLQEDNLKVVSRVLDYVTAQLTPAQLREFNAIRLPFDSAVAKAASGIVPPPLQR